MANVVRVINVHVNFVIDHYFRLSFLSVEGAQNPTLIDLFTERAIVVVVLVLLTAYKLLSYRNQLSRT